MSDDLYQEMVQFLQSIGPNILPQNLEKVSLVLYIHFNDLRSFHLTATLTA